MVNRKKLLTPILIVLLALSFWLTYQWFQNQFSSKISESSIRRYSPSYLSPSQIPNPPYVQPTIPPPPDFSKEEVKSRNIFDISTWNTYDYPPVGLRLKYPPEWGTPQTLYRQGGQSGKIFAVHFSNYNDFRFGGTSSDFSEGRSGSWRDFNGFGKKATQNLFWENPQELCQGQLFCQQVNNTVHLLANYNSQNCEGPALINNFEPILFIDRPQKTISGLAFGGEFITPQYSSYFCDWNEKTLQSFGKAIIDRKLDAQSMRNYDLYEKVFETVETY